MGQPFGPGIEDDHDLPSGCPARSRDACREPGRPPGRNGMDYGLDLRASHFSGLVNRDPRREEPSPPIAWPSVRRSPPGSLRKAVSHHGEWRRAPPHTLARTNTSITDHNVGLSPPVKDRVRLPLGARPELQGLPKEGLFQQQSLGYRDDASARVQLVYVSFYVTMRRGGENAAKNLQGRPNRPTAQVVPGPPHPQIVGDRSWGGDDANEEVWTFVAGALLP